jgi:catechol 2,3-dioxygenase-like lactoylglutathione lyase family enzyme
MDDSVTRLFDQFDRGLVSRRSLLQALGFAAVAAPFAPFGRAIAQGSCGGDNAALPRCNKTELKAPFDPTGYKTVFLDHFKLQCADPKAEAAYYATLMNWKVRSDDGNIITLDIGDTLGAVEIRGGYQPPPPPTPPPAAANPPAAAGGDSAGRGGRGGGGGGRGNRAPLRAVWDGMCWGIDKWDTKRVEADLAKRGLNPVADHDPKRDFYSFHVKDPDGFDVQLSNGNAKNRRQGAPKGTLPAPAPFEPTNWKTMWLDHISFGVTDYKESVAFYEALLGWKRGGDEGSQDTMEISPNIGGIIIRGGNRFAPEGQRGAGGRGGANAVRRASMGHISFGISPWDSDAVGAELDKRGLNARVDTGTSVNTREGMRTAPYQSYHTPSANGWDLQISNRISRNTGGGGDR